ERIFRPFIWALSRTGNAVLRLAGLGAARGLAGQVHSVTELTMMVEASERAGVLERQEREMVHGVLAIGDMTARQIMIPRADMVSVRLGDPTDRIVQVALESGYSRLPVLDPATGDVLGILHAKDLLGLFAEAEQGLVVVQDLLRRPTFVRADTRLTDLLRQFQRGEMHLALVQDEFGEVIGLVTMEDLLEEIVGEIRDEHDTAERLLRLEQDGSFLTAGGAPVRACLSALGVTPPLWAGGALSDFLRTVRSGPLQAGARLTYEDLAFTVQEDDGAGGARLVRIVKGGR
ncbi:MAG: hemolysin family protein, partial [bacterium]